MFKRKPWVEDNSRSCTGGVRSLKRSEPVAVAPESLKRACLHPFRGLLSEPDGQAIAEFSLVVFLLVLILFAILETGLLLNEKLVLTSTAREVARVCAVEGGKTQNALARLNELLSSAGIDPASVSVSIRPNQAIYGTTITVDLSYGYVVKSPIVRSVIGSLIPVSAKAVTRSEFVPR